MTRYLLKRGTPEPLNEEEKGFYLAEVLISLVIIGLLGIMIQQSLTLVIDSRDRISKQVRAQLLATSRFETLMLENPINLDSNDNLTEKITLNQEVYTRSTTITVNADLSRTVVVNVLAPTATTPAVFTINQNIPLRGPR